MVCPYYKRERYGFLYCEICRFKFPNKEVRRDWVYSRCASVKGWEDCEMKRFCDNAFATGLMVENDVEETK